MQHFVKFHAQTFLESRSSSKLKDCTISENIYFVTPWILWIFSHHLNLVQNYEISFSSSCFSVVNILFGNPKPCGSKFLRIQLWAKSHVACPSILGIQILIQIKKAMLHASTHSWNADHLQRSGWPRKMFFQRLQSPRIEAIGNAKRSGPWLKIYSSLPFSNLGLGYCNLEC